MYSEQDVQYPIVVWSGGSVSVCDRFEISLSMVIIPRRSSSVSGSLLLEAWVRKHRLALVVADNQDRHFQIRRVIRVWMEV